MLLQSCLWTSYLPSTFLVHLLSNLEARLKVVCVSFLKIRQERLFDHPNSTNLLSRPYNNCFFLIVLTSRTNNCHQSLVVTGQYQATAHKACQNCTVYVLCTTREEDLNTIWHLQVQEWGQFKKSMERLLRAVRNQCQRFCETRWLTLLSKNHLKKFIKHWDLKHWQLAKKKR